ncbi:MAG: ComEC/Rec2 family competence protein, partial [Chitinophagaceae bacterium]
LVTTGALITSYNQPFQQNDGVGRQYNGNGNLKLVLQEPLTKKARSYKAIASVRQLYTGDSIIPVKGNVILYFSPDIQPGLLSYGSTILINKRLQPVKSSGNPGAFDYQRYCSFQNIAHQVYLTPNDFTVTGAVETRVLKKLVFQCRQRVIDILRTYIRGEQEAALAEALLIGYKDDVDKEFVQAYSNTGVVHIIAVSGLHLGIIYWLLSLMMKPLAKKRSLKWASVVFILAGLWLFSLLAGAGPSVIRSAVMFSFIVIGNAFSKRSSIYNNLAASAFLLLCWNPFWLWDVGFQLSYAAVLSIVLFFRPVYNMLYVKNKLPDAIWKLNAVTLSAQVLTVPLCLYHFHQFPNFFLLANLVAVPLSSLLLIGEIVLCLFAFVPLLAEWTGIFLYYAIKLLNIFIENINALPFASWNHLLINLPQTLILLGFIAAVAYWLTYSNKTALFTSLLLMSVFMLLRSDSFITASSQRKLIIYNVPGKSAMDFVDGRNYYFAGDAIVQTDAFLSRFHLEPSRILHRINNASSLNGLVGKGPFFSFYGKRILVLDKNRPLNIRERLSIDLLILSHNPPHVKKLLTHISVKQVVADASNSFRNTKEWQLACKDMHIGFHNVTESGAFILNLKPAAFRNN